MQEGKTENPQVRTPAGFTPRSGGLASEYAREMGWGLNEPQRAKEPEEKQDADGGTNYDYGAADFGDSAKDAGEAGQPVKNEAKAPAETAHKPPIIIIPAPKTTQKSEQKPGMMQKPRKRIA